MNPLSNTKRRLPFVQVDVFTSVPLEGNQLAVFADGSGLSDAEMQALAKETNLSETTFIIPRDAATERERGVRVRIFTTTEELPFAGHPTLGTAMVLRNDALHGNGAEEIALELNIGRIPVRFSTRDGLPFGIMTQRDPEFKQKHSREEVARASGLAIDDVADDLPIQTVSTGNPFAIVPLKSLAIGLFFTVAILALAIIGTHTILDGDDPPIHCAARHRCRGRWPGSHAGPSRC